MSFKTFFDSSKMLAEKLITFGGKAYPKFGNILILGGGSGSGKGYQIKNLIGLEGKTIDVDRLKELALKSPLMLAKYPELKNVNLKKPEDVFLVHNIVNKKEKLNTKMTTALKKSIFTSTTQLPNLIFDTTLHEIDKLKEISEMALDLGYQKQNIHIVWVLNDIEVARQQNKERSRVVPDDILLQAHAGASKTFAEIIHDSETTRKYMDGDIWISFNVADKDVGMEVPSNKRPGEFGKWMKGSKTAGNYVNKADYIKVKSQGKPVESSKILTQEILKKIKSYVPGGKF